jgi:ribose-phosphate pyrophosphokinase
MTVVIAMPGSDAQAAQLARRLTAELVIPEVRPFPDGEIYVRIEHELAGHDALVFGSLYPRPAERFMTVAFLAATARERGAGKVGLVAPYLAFMRQDSVFKPGEGMTSRYFAHLVSCAVDWMVTVDPHLHRHHSLDGLYTIPTAIARAAPAIASWIQREVPHPYLIGPDAESEQWVRATAEACGAPFEILEKTRRGDREVEISAPRGGWNGHTPVLIDDIVSTGKTLIEATRRLRAAGSAAPMCVAIHAVFADADQVVDELTAAGAAGIVTCDTIAHASNRIGVTESLAEAAQRYLG